MTSKALSITAMVLMLFGSAAASAAVKVQCLGMTQDANYCLDDMCSDKSSVVLKEFDHPYSMKFAFSGEADSKLRTAEYDYESRYELSLYKAYNSAAPQLEVRIKNSDETRLSIEAKVGQKFQISHKASADSGVSARHVLKCEVTE